MNIPHYEPRSEVLKEHVDLYYFMETEYDDPYQFFAFPHYGKPMNIHRGIEYAVTGQEIAVKGIDQYRPQILLQGRFQKPILVRFSGTINKITVIFRDGALCNFIQGNFTDVAANHTQLFSAWDHLSQYDVFKSTFFTQHDHKVRIEILEQFLLSVLQVKRDWPLYWQASTLLKDVEADYSIADVAKKLFMSEKTLNRLVFKFTGMSPSSLKKIIQFRYSLQKKILADSFHSLTDIAYKSNYYDASYFNKIYKSLTLKSPGKFFKNVDLYCGNVCVFERRENV